MTTEETLARAETPLSPSEQTAAQARLWGFLGKRVRRYTMGESESLPMETARALLDSALFLFALAGAGERDLLAADLDALFATGLRRCEAQRSRGRLLWQSACAGLPPYGSRPMAATLRSIGQGFDRYDCRYFACEFPCDIDYQLCRPVPETLVGILYVNEYLRRIAAENSLLRRLDRDRAARLLENRDPGYRGEILNLCEPLLLNAAGLALCGGNPQDTAVAPAQCAALLTRFAPLDRAQTGALLAQGARAACNALGVTDGYAVDYLAAAAADTAPRLLAAAKVKELGNLFSGLAENKT